jgi:flagellar biosynthesis/type III secretory pathway protein FliH
MPEFVLLADRVRPPREQPAPVAVVTNERVSATPLADDSSEAQRESVREARLFRARLADALDAATARLLREIAADVLARELRLGACDLAAIVARVLQGAPATRVRVAPCDAGVVLDVPTVVDPQLAAGDAIVELHGGEVDARLGVRLACALGALT